MAEYIYIYSNIYSIIYVLQFIYSYELKKYHTIIEINKFLLIYKVLLSDDNFVFLRKEPSPFPLEFRKEVVFYPLPSAHDNNRGLVHT